VKDVRGPVSTFMWVRLRIMDLSLAVKWRIKDNKGIQEIWGILNRLAPVPVNTVT
jgi:hypothetical protein